MMISDQLATLRARRAQLQQCAVGENGDPRAAERAGALAAEVDRLVDRLELLLGIYNVAIQWNSGSAIGIELGRRAGDRASYCAILEEPDGSGRGRIVYFDESALYQHEIYSSPDEALQQALIEGYIEWSPGTMDSLAATPAWRTCIAQCDLICRYSSGEIDAVAIHAGMAQLSDTGATSTSDA